MELDNRIGFDALSRMNGGTRLCVKALFYYRGENVVCSYFVFCVLLFSL